MLTQSIAKHGYLPIIPLGLAGLALGIAIGELTIDDAVLAAAPPFEHRWAAVESAPRQVLPLAARWPAAPDRKAETKPATEPKPGMRLASVDPGAKLLDETDRPASKDYFQPVSKGYIMYSNSPTHWTPVPLPDDISADRAPHNKNIRAEIEQAAMLFDVDMRMMKAFAKIESGYRPKATTGRYKCLFQLSDWEFRKYWQGDIYDIRNCSIAAARKFATEAAQFEKDVGRKATAAEIYCIHQQGYQGCAFHHDAPHQLAWKNMFFTAEGQEKGEKWARKAIWGNVPSDVKDKIKGGLDALTSGEFIAMWTERVERFMARKVEPPTTYAEEAIKTKKPSKLAAGKKTKVAAGQKPATGQKNATGQKKKKTKVAAS